MFSLDLVSIVCSYAMCGSAKAGHTPAFFFSFKHDAIAGSVFGMGCNPINSRVWCVHGRGVLVFDADGEFLHIPTVGPSVSMKNGGSVAFDNNNGDVYLACGQIVVHSADGTFLRSFGGKINDQFDATDGIALDREGLVYAADYSGSQIVVLQKDGTFVRAFSGIFAAGDRIVGPRGVLVSNEDEVYVADTVNDSIHVCDLRGNRLRKFAGYGTAPGRMNSATGLAFDHDGQLLVCDGSNNRIQDFTRAGAFITMFGQEGSEEHMRLLRPLSVAVDRMGRILVGDNDCCVKVFAFST